jgi:hypothetical protein
MIYLCAKLPLGGVHSHVWKQSGAATDEQKKQHGRQRTK